MRPYPWLFVAVTCTLILFAPRVFRLYTLRGWHVPLWHYFIAILFAALVYASTLHIVVTIHSIDELFYNWERGIDPGTWDAPEVRANVPFTPTTSILRDMVRRSSMPLAFAIAATFLITYLQRRRASQ